jgi:predicted Holliday junction resolvase-like endonuclease
MNDNKRLEDMLVQLIQSVGATNAEMNKMKRDTDQRFVNVEQRLDRVEQRLDEMDRKIDETRRELGSKLDAVLEGQKRQERILELLSTRSIEQEAEIRELRQRIL